MERLKNMSLKKSFVCITVGFLLAATLLSALTVACFVAMDKGEGDEITISMDKEDGAIAGEMPSGTKPAAESQTSVTDILQIALPVVFYVAALLLSSATFYRLKLKKPLFILQSAAGRIKEQDLDFTVEKVSDDELGELSGAFETMRGELLKSNRELWRQAEERKQLNAAFAHDLRNPVTVLKGSASMLQKGLEKGALTEASSGEAVSLIEQYANRIENYVEAMTNAQKLEDLKFAPKPYGWSTLSGELKNSLTILSEDGEANVVFFCDGEDRQVDVDRDMIFNTAENLMSNALRYARSEIKVDMSCDGEKITVSFADDGPGFPDHILNKGAMPFLRDGSSGQGKHFGMGLYICRLLCEKHHGSLKLENSARGGKTTATFYFKN